MKKIVGVASAALMTMTVLAGCGGGSDSAGSYCDDISSAKSELGGLSGAQFTAAKFDALNSAVHKIAGEAPSDIKGSWTLIADQFDALDQAMSEAGLTMDDFGALTKGQTPPGLTAAELTALETKLKSFDSTGVTTATDKIQTQVKADCNLELNTN